MFTAWLLVITKDLRVHMPPELYEGRDRAELEARRWLTTLLGWRPARKGMLVAGQPVGRGQYLVHLKELELPASWRANPLFACVDWSDRVFPQLHLELIAAGHQGAHDWVDDRMSLRKVFAAPILCGEWAALADAHDRKNRIHVAAHRVKFVHNV